MRSLLVLLSCLIAACGAPAFAAPAPAATPAPATDGQDAGAEPVRRRVEIEVVLSRHPEGQVWVEAPAWGAVKRVLVEPGAQVTASDPLFEIEPPPPPGVAAARAALNVAGHDRKRQEELHRMGEPERDWRNAVCAEERARREVDRARRGPGAPRSKVVVRASIDGEVVRLFADPGTMVDGPEIPGCPPSSLATLQDPTRLHAIAAKPPPGKAPSAGAAATLRIPDLPGMIFGARVVAWGADQVLVEVDNRGGLLRAGMKGKLVVEE
jgi:biotin carboxyl carrier protein